jgi:hypothetical protein
VESHALACDCRLLHRQHTMIPEFSVQSRAVPGSRPPRKQSSKIQGRSRKAKAIRKVFTKCADEIRRLEARLNESDLHYVLAWSAQPVDCHTTVQVSISSGLKVCTDQLTNVGMSQLPMTEEIPVAINGTLLKSHPERYIFAPCTPAVAHMT